MAVKCKLSASTITFYFLCFLLTTNISVNGVRGQQKRIKGAKGEILFLFYFYFKKGQETPQRTLLTANKVLVKGSLAS